MKHSFPLLMTLATLLMLIAMTTTGCSSAPDFTRYRVEVSGYLSGDTAICGSIALVDTSGDFRFGFTNKCFTFKPSAKPLAPPGEGEGKPPVAGE